MHLQIFVKMIIVCKPLRVTFIYNVTKIANLTIKFLNILHTDTKLQTTVYKGVKWRGNNFLLDKTCGQ